MNDEVEWEQVRARVTEGDEERDMRREGKKGEGKKKGDKQIRERVM